MRSRRQAWGRGGWQANYNRWEWLWKPDSSFQNLVISFVGVRGRWVGAAREYNNSSITGPLDLSCGGLALRWRVQLHLLTSVLLSNFVCYQFAVLNPFLLELPRMVPSSWTDAKLLRHTPAPDNWLFSFSSSVIITLSVCSLVLSSGCRGCSLNHESIRDPDLFSSL